MVLFEFAPGLFVNLDHIITMRESLDYLEKGEEGFNQEEADIRGGQFLVKPVTYLNMSRDDVWCDYIRHPLEHVVWAMRRASAGKVDGACDYAVWSTAPAKDWEKRKPYNEDDLFSDILDDEN